MNFLFSDFLIWGFSLTDVIGNFYSPSAAAAASEREDQALVPSKLSKSAQNLKILLADVTKPNQEDGAAAAQALLESSKKTNRERKLYCTAISRYCFKAGRKTIPPWFVIATSGYGTFASTRTNWDKVRDKRKETGVRENLYEGSTSET